MSIFKIFGLCAVVAAFYANSALAFPSACDVVEEAEQTADIIAANLANMNTTRDSDGGPYKRKELRCDSRGCEIRESAEIRMVYEPNHPDADDYGYVSYPNIDPIAEMNDLIANERKYQAAKKECAER